MTWAQSMSERDVIFAVLSRRDPACFYGSRAILTVRDLAHGNLDLGFPRKN